MEQVAVTGIAFHDLFDIEFPFGTGTDKGHLTTKDVPKLGEFVEVMFTQELTDFGHTFIFSTGIEGRTVFFSIELHTAELVDVKRTTETADTFLFKDGRTSVFPFYGNVAEQEQGGEYNQGDQGNQTVNDTFGISLETIHPIRNKMIVFFDVFKIYHKKCYFNIRIGKTILTTFSTIIF